MTAVLLCAVSALRRVPRAIPLSPKPLMGHIANPDVTQRFSSLRWAVSLMGQLQDGLRKPRTLDGDP